MAYEDHMEFLEVVQRANSMAIDDLTAKRGPFSPSDFIKHLYVERSKEDEEAVRLAVDSADRFVVVVAPTGGGKSSVVHNALHSHLDKQSGYFLFDFKDQVEKFYDMGKEPDERMAFIRDAFKSALEEQFLADIDTKIRFVFKALSMFLKQKRLHSLIFRYRAKYDNPEIGSDMKALEDIFSTDFAAVGEEEQYVMANLTCAQTISAIKATLGLKRFMVILDNVDRIRPSAQPYLFSVAIDIHQGGNGDFGTIVAIREKNLHRFEEAGANGDVVKVVSLTSSREERTKPLRLKLPEDGFIRQLIDKRHAYVDTLLKSKGVMDKMNRSRQLFALLRPMATERFIEERLHNLSNHSCRVMLTLDWSFIAYLFRLADANVIISATGEVTVDEFQVRSYLYRWMYAIHNPNHEFLRDIVSRYAEYKKGQLAHPLLCDIELVILAWLVNHDHLRIRARDVVRAFSTLAVPEDVLLGSLQALYDTDISCRYVDIGDCEEHCDPVFVRNSNPRIQVTPLGAEFVTNTITKMEFLHQAIAFPDLVSAAAKEVLTPVAKNVSAKVETVLSFLRDMRLVHTDSMKRIHDACREYPSWEDYYRKDFCIDKKLIFEREIVSHLRHLRKSHPPTYDSFKQRYADELEQYYKEAGLSATVRQALYEVDGGTT